MDGERVTKVRGPVQRGRDQNLQEKPPSIYRERVTLASKVMMANGRSPDFRSFRATPSFCSSTIVVQSDGHDRTRCHHPVETLAMVLSSLTLGGRSDAIWSFSKSRGAGIACVMMMPASSGGSRLTGAIAFRRLHRVATRCPSSFLTASMTERSRPISWSIRPCSELRSYASCLM